MSDPLCVCGHRASNHATPDSGDTRCLAVDARVDLLYVFDDGRDGAYGYARLMAVITHAGIGWTLARTWKGSRARERQLKRQGGASRRCPICRANQPSRG